MLLLLMNDDVDDVVVVDVFSHGRITCFDVTWCDGFTC